MNNYLILAGLFALAQTGAWFQLNSQYVWSWWSNRPIVSAVLFGVPTSVAFWYAWKITTSQFDSVWSSRFIGSSIGMLVFAVLSWSILGEGTFNVKTMTCLLLSVLIIFIQIRY
jgi:hypothetical protein